MKKVIARPFLGKEKYRDYKLCYMDEIPETLSELTEESKAWKKSADYRETKNAYLKIKNFLHKYSIGLSPP